MSETLLQMNHIRKHFGDLHVLEEMCIRDREMTAEKMVFPFYKEFAENITFMHKYMDKTMVEYHVHDGNRAVIHYLVEREGNVENEYRKEEMKNMYDGICVKEFVLFFGERLQYYIVELEDGKEQLNESGTFSRSDTDTNQKISRYLSLIHI